VRLADHDRKELEMEENESTQETHEDPSTSPEKTDREEGGPTSSESPGEETGGAAGTRPTEGFEPHE
jgi:hypothetical protein